MLSYENPDREKIIDAFTYWPNFVEYLVFRKENIYTYEKEYKMAKTAKRGNDVYSAKVRKRLNYLYNLPQIEFFNYKDRNRVQKTRAVFVTLTYRRDDPLDILWKEVGRDFNRWISGLRCRYKKIDVLRCWEAQSDGYPHIHCVLLFHEVKFDTFFHNNNGGLRKRRL
ncbi:MAG: hypothetical protein NWE89_04260 [Candidatus Bathyarchaeota archaeon]|nr:hypothetical protein [Candidatus Bathyarchaeota archaeon]